ncbi:MAG TPA: hypothetical protein IAC30_02120 [Candidatus Faecousia intestinavium]|nr:hypothetical protein [Candidatus Faecousia intestinavium]
MQFKTSCCNKTLLKKDLTRFAPLWGLYTLGLLMILFLTWDDKSIPFNNVFEFENLFSNMALCNGVYALITAAMLFGDLYNTRMCYGTHALPMTRGCWFGTHILSGLVFSLIPTALMAAASIPLLNAVELEQGWQLGLYLFLDMNLQYLTFFGIGVFAAMCAGNRFGLTAIYGMLMVGSVLLYLPADALLAPMLFGVTVNSSPYERLSPFYSLMSSNLIVIDDRSEVLADGTLWCHGSFTLGYGWPTVFLLAGLGVVFLVLAYLLYRRRNLESAGDFLAVPKLRPLIGGCLAVMGASAALAVLELFGYYGSYDLTEQLGFAFVGLTIGWFAGQMFLERTTRVFGPKKWAGLLVMLALAAGVMGLTKLDPLGIDDWVPEVSEIRGARINGSYYVDTPEELAQVIQVQEFALEEHLTEEDVEPYLATDDVSLPKYARIQIVYTKNNGMGAIREYYVASDSQAGDLLRSLTSKVSFVFGRDEITSPQKLMACVGKPDNISVSGYKLPEELLTEETVRSLFEAVIADCEEGTLSPISVLHPTKVYQTENGDNLYLDYMWLEVALPTGKEGRYLSYNLRLFPDSENVLAWAESVGITWDVIAQTAYG